MHKHITKIFFWGGSVGFILSMFFGVILDLLGKELPVAAWVVLMAFTLIFGLGIISWAVGMTTSREFHAPPKNEPLIPRKYYLIILALLVVFLLGRML